MKVEMNDGKLILFLPNIPICEFSEENQKAVSALSSYGENSKLAITNENKEAIAFILARDEFSCYEIFEMLAKIPGVSERINDALKALMRLRKRQRTELNPIIFARLLLERLNEFFKYI